MADLTPKTVGELPEASSLSDSDLFAISSNATSKKTLWSTIRSAIVTAAVSAINATYPLSVANGGTGATSVSGILSLLGINAPVEKYASTKQQTNMVWVDNGQNKPIYRVVVDCGNLPAGSESVIDSGITNASVILTARGFGVNGTNWFFIPYSYSSSQLGFVYFDASNGKIHVSVPFAASVKVILEYTESE